MADPGALDLSGLAVVVVSYRSHQLLRTHLAGVAGQLRPAQVVVVDSFSSDGERAEVRRLCESHRWVGVYPDRNVGFGGGCNLGVRAATQAGATRLLLLNPDATIDRGSVERLWARVDADPMTLAAPTIRRPDGSVWSAGSDLDLDTGDMRSWRRRAEFPDARTMPWLTGACLLLDARLWRAVGGFDEDYFLYWEDVDLSARVRDSGGTLALVPGASAVHDEGGTHGEGAGGRARSSLYYYYNTRNRLLFARKHLDEPDRRRWRRRSLAASYRILLRGGRRQLLAPAPWVAACRGLWDGLRE